MPVLPSNGYPAFKLTGASALVSRHLRTVEAARVMISGEVLHLLHPVADST